MRKAAAVLSVLALVIVAAQPAAGAEKEEEKESLSWYLGISGFSGLFPTEVDYLEPHRTDPPDPGEIDPIYIHPFTAAEANDGIDYRANHTRLGPVLTAAFDQTFEVFFSVGLTLVSLTSTFDPGVSITHPPVTTLLDATRSETTELDAGVDFDVGARLRFHPGENTALRISYAMTWGVSKLHSGPFFLSEMQGEYTYFIHRLGIRLTRRFELEGLGTLSPLLGVGGVIYRSKAEFGQRQGTEDWKVEWIQRNGFAVTAGLRLRSGALFAELVGRFFGERSVALAVGASL
jgi:hypothetical protein